ncbi:MAG: nicotinate-nucleotide--dimethylbenzimidazole phosphoribosyltransferase, partial [Treponema sp.]|nr:nicotinate-nucleotide--dimethylbenzimidazole phosphoribosyltransferase [Treponema sp.]
EEVGVKPFLDLNMRLGEGSGCPLAFEVVKAACVIMNDMASFNGAGIDDSYLNEIRKQRDF